MRTITKRIGVAKSVALLCVACLEIPLALGQGAAGTAVTPSLTADWKPQRNTAIFALAQALADDNPSVRGAAALALREMGPDAKAAIPALAHLLRDPDGYVRIDAAHTLERFHGDSVPSLLPLLTDCDWKTRALAVRTLEAIGPDAKAAIPALTERLHDPEPAVRDAATFALRAMGIEAKTAAPALASVLRDDDRWVRISAAKALEHLGPDAIPSIVPLVSDGDPRTRELAIHAMREIAVQYTPPSAPSPPQPGR